MRILFINYSAVPDMTESFLYDGLIQLLGRDVIDYPYNPWWHLSSQPKSGVLGAVVCMDRYGCEPPSKEEVKRQLSIGDYDLVVLGEDLPQVNEAYEEIKDKITVPIVRLDGFDDHNLHGIRPEIDMYFKRELFKTNEEGPRTHIFPMPVSIPFSRFPEQYSPHDKVPVQVPALSEYFLGEKDIDVSFICTPCTKARQRVHQYLRQLCRKHHFLYYSAFSPTGQHHTFGQRALSWANYVNHLGRSKVAVTIAAWPEDHDGFHRVTDFRYFEIAATGTYMVAQVPESVVPHDFVPDVEYGPIRSWATEEEDLKTAVLWALEHEKEREERAAQARVKAYTYHGTVERAQEFLDVVKPLVKS